MLDLTGKHWAQTVKRKRWVPVTLVLDKAKRVTGFRFRLLARASHRSWERACGIPPIRRG